MEVFTFLTEAVKKYDFSSFITLAIISLCALGVWMAIGIFKKTTDATLATNEKLLAVNHEISTNSINSVNALATVFKEFSMGASYNHKEVVMNLDTKHKEVVGHLVDIKKKIEELPRK